MTTRGERGEVFDDDELALCVAYVDGELERDEQLAFEQRLAAEPELAERVRALLETDELLRGVHPLRRRARARPARRRWAWVATCAAAAGLALWAVIALREPRPQDSFEVALAPGFESVREYVALHPELAELRAAGLDALRSGGEPPNVEPARFVEIARALEQTELRQRLSAEDADALSAPFFVLPLRLERESDVVVVALVDGEAPERLHPPPGADAASARLPAGEHLLPGERFEVVGSGAAQRVRYRRGYLAPIGAGELAVVVGVRAASGVALEPSAAELAARDRGALAEALREQGFEVRTLVVREPR